MRSKQLNFFIIEKDWKSISDFLLQNDILAISQPLYSENIYLSSDVSVKAEKDFEKVYLTTSGFKDQIFVDYIDRQNYYLVDDINSYVIEFCRGSYQSEVGELTRARLYFVTQYLQDGVIVKKDQLFINWANRVLTKFKRYFLPTNISGFGVSDNAYNWMCENNKSLSDSGLKIK